LQEQPAETALEHCKGRDAALPGCSVENSGEIKQAAFVESRTALLYACNQAWCGSRLFSLFFVTFRMFCVESMTAAK
jgi:hypothetical protein